MKRKSKTTSPLSSSPPNHKKIHTSNSNENMAQAQNDRAKHFRSLHKPGDPVVLTNCWDFLSAEAIAKLPTTKAMATASYGVARAAGMEDAELTYEVNLAGIKQIAKVAAGAQKPLTADSQNGYGDRLESFIEDIIAAGVVGINLEDYDKDNNKFYSLEEAVDRIKRVIKVAQSKGVPDFVVNARCDTLVQGGEMPEVLKRGKAYLDAGACTVFVWGGGKRGTSKAEVEEMIKAFGGMLNVSMKVLAADGLTVKDLAEMGVARISIGPQLQISAMGYLAKEAEKTARRGFDAQHL